MSDFKKHNKFALGASAVIGITGLILEIKPEFSLVLALAVYFGGNYPDLDTDSIPSRWAARIAIGASIYFVFIDKPVYAVIVCMVFIAPKIGNHRGWTHKFSTPILISIATFILFKPFTLIAVAFSLGFMAGHYLADGMSPFKLRNWI